MHKTHHTTAESRQRMHEVPVIPGQHCEALSTTCQRADCRTYRSESIPRRTSIAASATSRLSTWHRCSIEIIVATSREYDIGLSRGVSFGALQGDMELTRIAEVRPEWDRASDCYSAATLSFSTRLPWSNCISYCIDQHPHQSTVGLLTLCGTPLADRTDDISKSSNAHSC
jgi:hypothetical protein